MADIEKKILFMSACFYYVALTQHIFVSQYLTGKSLKVVPVRIVHAAETAPPDIGFAHQCILKA